MKIVDMTNDLNKKKIIFCCINGHMYRASVFLKTQIKYIYFLFCFCLIRKFADFIKQGRPKLNLKHISLKAKIPNGVDGGAFSF